MADIKIEGADDAQVNPSHYKRGGMECIDEMVALYGVDAVIHFCVCNAHKYRYRAGYKPDESADLDLQKAEWYIRKAQDLRDTYGYFGTDC